MNWHPLTTMEQLKELVIRSAEKPQVIFKHSIRCSISSVIKNRLDKEQAPDTADFHYLDLITYRPLSNAIAEQFKITHESPQVLVIWKGECIYDDSHMAINMDDILDKVKAA
ncbi:bacillithiol system redox-active protein YtxJ [Terrimonas sp. NA20]|uniref:Bacillithiol system redox-active protein YtxJ n=1 Tax=Terrimonas ginsenosidimutans TaxID=2908004 RepID=A0ABS9KX55_9BACT|nr:bacillithiol system redox-active protein YtxJ [Terrimonas ginsenosidimutans]MCG2616893.1 bacillithiol system redox-active protein YtxJ [Terrimonas ginsenosidimutans]